MEREDWEKIQQFDASTILSDCAFTSSKAMLKAIENWWSNHGEYILKACLKSLVICCGCGKKHISFSLKEEGYDLDDIESLIDDIERYPSTITEDEILINYPLCKECFEERG